MNNAEKTLEKFFNYYTTIPNLLHPIFEQHGENLNQMSKKLGLNWATPAVLEMLG